MKKVFLFFVILILLNFCIHRSYSQPVTFNYNGTAQNYTVPPCVYTVTVDVKGGEGASAGSGGASIGGKGGRVRAAISVIPGEMLNIYVGQKALSDSAGWNGGGTGGYQAGGGGGAADIRQGGTALSNRVVVAGGGGGGGFDTNVGYVGGNGGGSASAGNGAQGAYGGQGGTQSSGGTAGTGNVNGSPGVSGNGGNGSSSSGGGGGGGYYGGGGGAQSIWIGGGGGGGSSYAIPSATAVIHTQGFQTGDGQIIITPIISSGPSTPGTITGSNSVCINSSGNYSISSVATATSYSWTVPSGAIINSGQGTTTILVTFGSSSGNISVTASNSCGTSSANTKTVTVNPNPTVNAGSDESICLGDSIHLNAVGSGTFGWAPPGGLSCTSCSNPVAFPNLTTTYTVTITAVCGNASDEVTVMVDSCFTKITPASASNQQFTIIPNPTNGKFYLSLSPLSTGQACFPNGEGQYDVEIYNMLGEKVFEKTFCRNPALSAGEYEKWNCDLESRPSGIYIVKIFFENSIGIHKLIRQ